MKPKITVLMPVYNAEKYLHEAMDSILNQTFKDFELLIINDASKDDSKNIILSYQDSRIKFYENNKNLGVARTINTGLKLAKGDYIARMDADDISRKNRIDLQYKKFREDERVAIVGSHALIIDEVDNPFEIWKGELTPEEIFYTLQFKNCLVHSSVMFKKKIILDEFNGYSEKHEAEDYDLWLRVSKKYKICKINEPLIKLRIIKSSRIGSCGEKINKDALIIAKNNLQALLGKFVPLNITKVLADYSSPSLGTVEIKNALSSLEEINKKIVENCPGFLDHSRVRRLALRKEWSLRRLFFLASITHSKLHTLFGVLYKVYSWRKFYQGRNKYAE